MVVNLADGNNAVALLGNTLATGAILYVLITIFGPVSGAHFNPAVSFVFRLRGELDNKALIAFVAAQCAGGMAGTMLAHTMFELPLLTASINTRSGYGQWLAEGRTFGLVLTILGGIKHRADAANARRPLHYSRLLVYRIHQLRQSGGHAGARLY